MTSRRMMGGLALLSLMAVAGAAQVEQPQEQAPEVQVEAACVTPSGNPCQRNPFGDPLLTLQLASIQDIATSAVAQVAAAFQNDAQAQPVLQLAMTGPCGVGANPPCPPPTRDWGTDGP